MKIWVIFAALGAALAQTPAPTPALKGVIGEITAVNAAEKQLKVKADNGSAYTVKLDDKTTFVRVPPGEKDLKKASPIAFPDLAVGDRVLARGAVSEEDKTVPAKIVIVMTKSDLDKRHSEESAEWNKGIVGIVTSINPDTKEITVKPRTLSASTVVVDVSGNPGYLRFAPGSNRFNESKPSTFGDVKVGDNLRARGQKSEDGARVKADQILSGSFQTIAGTVVSVDTANNIVRITDLATKRPVEVAIGNETMARRIPPMVAMMLARRLNPDAAGGMGGPAAGGPGGPGGAGGRPPFAGVTGNPTGPAGTDSSHRPGGQNAGGQNGPRGSSGQAGPGGPPPLAGGPGVAGGPGRGAFDLHDMLEKQPAVQLSELKPGDALIVTSTREANASKIIAITLVAGVEPILASAPRTAGQVNLGAWNVDGGVPAQ